MPLSGFIPHSDPLLSSLSSALLTSSLGPEYFGHHFSEVKIMYSLRYGSGIAMVEWLNCGLGFNSSIRRFAKQFVEQETLGLGEI
ncbi:uncharacterized protein BDR25DRAFT_359160 [Lindgomyces ingoldianus]|uniref:Uncharacterized protein n=1 Tax=Lindgomyces ingoldianus TaxID=673940 RepID=A0ACB6QLZ3_9PLEO|nr:uncharacterized protein BDR25DRAFT_359160 [Lindgomyces ingoldianus]KAF2467135.1 hypothetical protein BDR25DRAFT_359160 [Lindgomyces ingoldianus]